MLKSMPISCTIQAFSSANLLNPDSAGFPDQKRKAFDMKKIYFIYNLKSGKGTIRSRLGDVIDLCTKAGYEDCTVYPSPYGCLRSGGIRLSAAL